VAAGVCGAASSARALPSEVQNRIRRAAVQPMGFLENMMWSPDVCERSNGFAEPLFV
jgi:hypothetical protein